MLSLSSLYTMCVLCILLCVLQGCLKIDEGEREKEREREEKRQIEKKRERWGDRDTERDRQERARERGRDTVRVCVKETETQEQRDETNLERITIEYLRVIINRYENINKRSKLTNGQSLYIQQIRHQIVNTFYNQLLLVNTTVLDCVMTTYSFGSV